MREYFTEADEKKFNEKYKCTSTISGWCSGTKVGSRMRCPAVSFTKHREALCAIGIEKAL